MIVIKRKVSLAFLGEDYTDSYLVFKSISVKEIEDIQKQSEQLKKDEGKAVDYIMQTLSSRFIEGTISGEAVKAEDLTDLPVDVLLECFTKIRGEIDPKA